MTCPTAPTAVRPASPPPTRGRPAAVDRLVVEVDARDGLAHLERVVCLLRGRRHPVAGLSSDLSGDLATIAVWGDGLHGGDEDAVVMLRLRRLPGVLSAWIEPGPAPA